MRDFDIINKRMNAQLLLYKKNWKMIHKNVKKKRNDIRYIICKNKENKIWFFKYNNNNKVYYYQWSYYITALIIDVIDFYDEHI